jgi:endo-1,4-beta-xylanase
MRRTDLYLIAGAVTMLIAAHTAAAQQEAPVWLEPTKAEPAGTRYRTFWSETLAAEVSYLVYLPPDYQTSADKRSPVVYWLHGLGGDQRRGAPLVRQLDGAIKAGEAPAMIAVLVNGQSASWYCDSADGRVPVESVIINGLIPHVDATYRTIAQREARVIEGWSMGGFGAAHLGFKYPELFGTVSILMGALFTPDDPPGGLGHAVWSAFSNDPEYYRSNNPWTLLERNGDTIRGKTHLRIVAGTADPLYELNQQYHELMDRLGLTHEFVSIEGAGHNHVQLYERMGDEAFSLYAKALAPGQ